MERRVAASIGGERNPVTGRNDGKVPDVNNPWLVVECKYRAEMPKWVERKIKSVKESGTDVATVVASKAPNWVLHALQQARKSSNKSQLPVVQLHKKNRRMKNDFIMVYWRDIEPYIDWINKDDGDDIALMKRSTFDRLVGL